LFFFEKNFFSNQEKMEKLAELARFIFLESDKEIIYQRIIESKVGSVINRFIPVTESAPFKKHLPEGTRSAPILAIIATAPGDRADILRMFLRLFYFRIHVIPKEFYNICGLRLGQKEHKMCNSLDRAREFHVCRRFSHPLCDWSKKRMGTDA